MDRAHPAHVPAPKRAQSCPACREAPTEAARVVRCPRCHATHHIECVWERSPCGGCGYDLEDEARRLAVLWVQRTLRWLLQLPGRWIERQREGVLAQRRLYGSLLASSLILTAVALLTLWIFFPSARWA